MTRLRSIPSPLAKNNGDKPVNDRRQQYEELSETLAQICEIEFGDGSEGADIGDLKERPLSNGLLDHMFQLMVHADFLDPKTIRKFYVELRLWGDSLAASRRPEGRRARKLGRTRSNRGAR